jgi:hypothetical protein
MVPVVSGTGRAGPATPSCNWDLELTSVKPRLIVADPDATTVAVDSSGVYWNSSSNGHYRLLRLENGGAVTTVATDAGRLLLLDAENVYWMSGGVTRMSKKDGKREVVARARSPIQRPIRDFVADDAGYYWAEERRDTFTIWCASKTGGKPRALVSGEKFSSESFKRALTGRAGLQIAAGVLYWMSGDRLRKLDTRAENPLVEDVAEVSAFGAAGDILAVSSKERLYVGQLRSQPVAIPLGHPWRPDIKLSVGGGYVFGSETGWRMKGAHHPRLWRAPLKGGCPEILGYFDWYYFDDNDFTIHEGHAYWIDRKGGGIFMSGS